MSLEDLLGLRVPVLLAAMAGGPTTPELVGAVSAAGGLGVFGLTGMTRGGVEEVVARARELAGGAPVGVNAILAPPTPATGELEDIASVLLPFRRELGLPDVIGGPPPSDPPGELVAAALGAGAQVVTTFGDPSPVVDAVRAAGAPLLAMVTTAEEAETAVALGASGVIAQGMEAGGHRGTFDVSGPLPLVGLVSLVPSVREAVGSDVPVIASGGIVDRAGTHAVLALGADAVSCGTVFLQAAEAGVPDVYRDVLRRCGPGDTVVSDVVSGRPARWIRNRLVDALLESGAGTLGWPAQYGLVGEIRYEAARQGRADLLPMLAGQRARASGPVRPAAGIVAELVPS
jgi:nitronate monooxygenase